MSAAIISGKAVAAKVCGNLQNKVKELAACGVVPGLAVILVGSDPASQIYVNAKARKCAELGIRSFKYVLPEDTSMAALLELIEKLNAAPEVDGILVQFPPPPQISEEAVISAIDPRKDVDCFHERNVGKLLIGKEDGFKPCTPYGILLLLEYSGIDPKGKHAVIVGRSNIVGKPLAALLMQKTKGADATVTVAHSGTRDLAAVTRSADILIVAVGRPNFVTADMVKPGAVHRCRHQPRAERYGQAETGRRCGFQRGGAHGFGDHARSGRRRADDHCGTDAQHGDGRPAPRGRTCVDFEAPLVFLGPRQNAVRFHGGLLLRSARRGGMLFEGHFSSGKKRSLP